MTVYARLGGVLGCERHVEHSLVLELLVALQQLIAIATGTAPGRAVESR